MGVDVVHTLNVEARMAQAAGTELTGNQKQLAAFLLALSTPDGSARAELWAGAIAKARDCGYGGTPDLAAGGFSDTSLNPTGPAGGASSGLGKVSHIINTMLSGSFTGGRAASQVASHGYGAAL